MRALLLLCLCATVVVQRCQAGGAAGLRVPALLLLLSTAAPGPTGAAATMPRRPSGGAGRRQGPL